MEAVQPKMIAYDKIFEAPSVNHWTKSDIFYLSLKVAAFASACAFFSLRKVTYAFAGYELARHVIQRLIMIPLYPLQSGILRHLRKDLEWENEQLDSRRVDIHANLSNHGYQVRHLGLKTNGITYSALEISHPDNKGWVLQATGNGEPIEHSAEVFAGAYKEMGLNVLLVNGPGAGRSGGCATPSTMGDAQLAGIHYLEKEIKAEKIVIAGRSLGGAAVGQAILNHSFSDKIDYLVVRQMTFSRVSHIAGEFVEKMIGIELRPIFKKAISWVIWWAGLEMDSIAASERLDKLGIHEVIVQGGCQTHITLQGDHFGNDDVISKEASLGYCVFLKNMNNKTYLFQSEQMCNGVYDHMHESSITLPGTLKLLNNFGVLS